jgi:uncharacterized protein
MNRWSSRKTSVVLWLLLVAFCGRVFGQLLVVLGAAPWLPPMKEWYSGLLPYPALLPVQVLIILVLAWICVDFTRGRGFWVSTRPFFARGMLVFAYVYLAVMLGRYALRMILVPEARWFGQTIPIFFHWVLASFLIVFGRFHRARLAEAGRDQGRV